jgi:purine-binding chemotaxis protein CheW
MSATATNATVKSSEMDCVTFRIGDLLIGLEIYDVEEINRQVHMTNVPHAPACVCGVENLRGNVVTIVDLRTILGLPAATLTRRSRNVIVHAGQERVGLLVDSVADVVRAARRDIEAPPANINGIDGRFFKGICKLKSELLVILDVEAVLDSKE